MTTINENIEVEEFDCEYCGNQSPADTMQMVDNSSEYLEVCYQCFEDYTHYCVMCDDLFTENNIVTCECWSPFCDYCYDNERYCCGGGASREYVNSYSHRPAPIFHAENSSEYHRNLGVGERSNEPRTNTVYYGVELELMSSSGDVSNLANFVALQTGEEYAYLKEDGSLGEEGVEIVTHPATIEHHVNLFPWKDIIDASIEDDLFDNDEAGVHVHLSREGLAPTRAEQANVGTKLLAVTEIFFDEIYDIAKRDASNWAERNMSRHPDYDGIAQMCKDETPIDCVKFHNELHDWGKSTKGRYVAVNFTNKKTIEFRIFRSTLDKGELLACIELVDTLVHIAKTHDLNEIVRMTFDDLLETVIDLGHDNLWNEWEVSGRA